MGVCVRVRTVLIGSVAVVQWRFVVCGLVSVRVCLW